MEFRPCIDIHNGKVKQIVGGTLTDAGNRAEENFVSEQDAAFYARLYKESGIRGGHVILLNREGTEYYEKTRQQAFAALNAYPGGLQAGGGIRDDNAMEYLEAGASHVIVTSYVFCGGVIDRDRLRKIKRTVGKNRLTLDLSCRKKGEGYYIVTDRWQKFTDVRVEPALLDELAEHCAEFLVHGVDAEGKGQGIEEALARMLGSWDGIPVTYAGGIGSFEDLRRLKELGQNRLHVTIGSALDLFGGSMDYQKIRKFIAEPAEK